MPHERPLKCGADHVAEDDRVGDLHHRRLRWTEKRTSSALARATCSARKVSRAAALMKVPSTTLAGQDLLPSLAPSRRRRCRGADRQGVIGGGDDGLRCCGSRSAPWSRHWSCCRCPRNRAEWGGFVGVVLTDAGRGGRSCPRAARVDRAAPDLSRNGRGRRAPRRSWARPDSPAGDALGLQLGDGRLSWGPRRRYWAV